VGHEIDSSEKESHSWGSFSRAPEKGEWKFIALNDIPYVCKFGTWDVNVTEI
jgi:hypothetical protein